MFTYNKKNYQDFSEFATAFANVFDHVDFAQATTINKQVDSITSEDVACAGVYEIDGKRFAISQIFEGIETTTNGNENKRKRRLVKFENSVEIKRFDDITQLKRILGAATGQNPSGIKCGKNRKQSFKTATPDNIGQIKAQLDALLETLQPLTEVADIAQDIARIRCAIRNVWAQQLSVQRAEARKADALKTLSGLTPDQIERLMQLL